MTDRELLELAAKAAGLYFHGHRKTIFGDATWVSSTGDTDDQFEWNPLTDDGQVFRLANALRLIVCHAELAVIVKDKQYSWEWIGEIVNEDTGDRNASARRAIVRAAAEIGKGMK